MLRFPRTCRPTALKARTVWFWCIVYLPVIVLKNNFYFYFTLKSLDHYLLQSESAGGREDEEVEAAAACSIHRFLGFSTLLAEKVLGSIVKE